MFTPGTSGNPKGKPKGATNKNTKELRGKIALILNNNIDKVQTDLEQLQPKDRLNVLLQFMKFVIPTLKQVEVEHQEHQENFRPIIIDFTNEKR